MADEAKIQELQEKLREAQERQKEQQATIDRIRGERNEANSKASEMKTALQNLQSQHTRQMENEQNSTTGGSAGVQAPTPIQNLQVYSATVGCIAEYNENEDWKNYQDRLEQYFIVNNIMEPRRRVATLITVIGTKGYGVLANLCDPESPSQKSYDELCAILKKQYSKTLSVFRERTEFFDLKQSENESVNQWYVRLKDKASTCQWGAQLDLMVTNKFVAGLKKGKVLDRVCEEDHTKDSVQIVEVAKRKEAALIQSYQEVSVHKVNFNNRDKKSEPKKQNRAGKEGAKKQYNNNKDKRDFKGGKRCTHCGYSNHESTDCKFKLYKCNYCDIVGHLEKICRKKEKEQAKQHFVEVERDDWTGEEVHFHTTKVGYVKPTQVQIKIGHKPLLAELDSGASRSVIPEELYKKHLSQHKLHPANTTLRFYDGSAMAPEGQIDVEIRAGKKKANCQLIVVKTGCRLLLGRDMMHALGYKIVEINHVDSMDPKLREVINKHKALFDGKFGKYKYGKVDIKMQENAKPVFCKPRTTPFAFKKTIGDQLDQLEKEGILTKVKHNEWGTPLVPVLKKGGGVRICGDYKVTINKHMQDVKHPAPRVEEVFAELGGGEKFTKLDMSAAYNQLELTDKSKKLCAWSTPKGIYLHNRLPYGTKTAAAEFDKVIEQVLQGAKGTAAFRDDIVVTGKNDHEHVQNLDEVLQRLEEAGLKLNLKKCQFFQEEIKYLGHIISKEGLSKDPEKVAAMVEAKRPENTTDVKAFTGLVTFYGKFVPKLAEVLKPIYDVQNKEKFQWTMSAEKAFIKVKEELASDRNLVHYNPDYPMKLVTDASDQGIAAVLLHVMPNGEDRPITFISRTLTKAEGNYAILHKEALAIYWAFRKLYQYLAGTHFKLCTDHRPLITIFGEHKGIPQMAAGRLQRWALFMSGFDYQIEHIKGKINEPANALSRLPRNKRDLVQDEEDYLHFMVEDQLPLRTEDLARETRKDPVLSKVFLYTTTGWPSQIEETIKPFAQRKQEIFIEKNVLMWGYRVLIPETCKQILLKEIHGGHMGISKMKAIARQYFWWPNLDKDIEGYAKGCMACLTESSNPEKSELKKFPDSKYAFERVHIDFLGPHRGKMYLILVDAYSRWPEIMHMMKTDSASTIEKLKEVFARYGLPDTLISDNGAQLVSEEFEEFCKMNGILHRTGPPYHPQTNGLAENGVKSFKKGLEKALKDNKAKDSVNNLISKYLFAYRNAPHLTTGESPANRFLGRNLRSRLDLLKMPKSAETIQRQVKYFRGHGNIAFSEGERVIARDYKNPMKPGWQPATVEKVIGERTYICKPDFQPNIKWKRSNDQMRKSGQFYESAARVLLEQDRINEPEEEPTINDAPNVSVSNQEQPTEDSQVVMDEPPAIQQEIQQEGDHPKEIQPTPKRNRPRVKIEPDPNLNVNQREPRVRKPVNKMNI